MPPRSETSSKALRRLSRWRNLRQATRIASRATKRATREAGITNIPTRPILKREPIHPDYPYAIAMSTSPITWAVTPGGRLSARKYDPPVYTARHEVAHLLGAGHPAIRAARAELSAAGMRGAARLEKEPKGRKAQRISRQLGRWGRAPSQ